MSNLALVRRPAPFSRLTPLQGEWVAATVVKCRFKHEKAIVGQGKQFIALFILRTGRACVMATDTPRLQSYFGHPAPR